MYVLCTTVGHRKVASLERVASRERGLIRGGPLYMCFFKGGCISAKKVWNKNIFFCVSHNRVRVSGMILPGLLKDDKDQLFL